MPVKTLGCFQHEQFCHHRRLLTTAGMYTFYILCTQNHFTMKYNHQQKLANQGLKVITGIKQ